MCLCFQAFCWLVRGAVLPTLGIHRVKVEVREGGFKTRQPGHQWEQPTQSRGYSTYYSYSICSDYILLFGKGDCEMRHLKHGFVVINEWYWGQ